MDPFRVIRLVLGLRVTVVLEPARKPSKKALRLNRNAKGRPAKTVLAHESDFWFNAIVMLPILLGIVSLFLPLFGTTAISRLLMLLPSGALIAWGISMWVAAGVRVNYPGEFVAILFLGKPRFHFSGWVLYIPFFMKKITVSRGAHFVRTPEVDEKFADGLKVEPYEHDELRKRALRTQIPQGILPDDFARLTGEMRMRFIGVSDEQVVVLKIVFEVDAEHPAVFLKRFTELLSDHDWNVQDAWNRLTNLVANLIVARSDQVFPEFTIDQCLLERALVNRRLKKKLSPYVMDLGVVIVQIMVEDVMDVPGVTNGYVSTREKTTRAENTSKSDQQISEADQKARVYGADQNRIASEAEQEARRLIAEAQANALVAVAAAKALEADASLKLKAATIKLYSPDNPALGVFLMKFEGIPNEQLPENMKAALQSAGLHLEGGTLFTLDGFSKLVPAGILQDLATKLLPAPTKAA